MNNSISKVAFVQSLSGCDFCTTLMTAMSRDRWGTQQLTLQSRSSYGPQLFPLESQRLCMWLLKTDFFIEIMCLCIDGYVQRPEDSDP